MHQAWNQWMLIGKIYRYPGSKRLQSVCRFVFPIHLGHTYLVLSTTQSTRTAKKVSYGSSNLCVPLRHAILWKITLQVLLLNRQITSNVVPSIDNHTRSEKKVKNGGFARPSRQREGGHSGNVSGIQVPGRRWLNIPLPRRFQPVAQRHQIDLCTCGCFSGCIRPLLYRVGGFCW